MGLSDDLLKPYAPGWLLKRLDDRLCARAEKIAVYDRYYRGSHPLLFASKKFREAFGGLFREFADNWTAVVVDACEERLDVDGFRFGKPDGDKEAWDIWQANQLDAESQIGHTEALVSGVAAVLVEPSDGKYPTITIEHANQVYVEHAEGSRRNRVAALKKWMDDDGYINANVYTSDHVYKFRSSTARKTASIGALRTSSWEVREVDDEEWPLRHQLGVVPIVPLVNRPRLLTSGVSEIREVIPIQDAINKLVADMLVASEYAAIRQRWATGMEIPVNPETNEPIEPFKPMLDRLFISEDPDTEFGEFGAADLNNYVTAIDMFVQHVASQTRTPPHYFTAFQGQFPSGEAIKSAEAGLVAKSRRKMRSFGESWEEVMRLAFAAMGKKKKAEFVAAETIWGDPEYRTEGEHVDAVLKKRTLGVPDEQLWEDVGYTPQQIERFKVMRAEQPVRPIVVDVGSASTEGES